MLEQESPNIAPTPTLSQPGLLVMDVDSTLIDEEVIDELGAAAGIGEQIASITARAMNGELDFREALQARVALLKDLPTSVFDDVYRRVHFTQGALDLIDALHAHGWKSAWFPAVSMKSWTVLPPTRILIFGLRIVWKPLMVV